MDEEQKLQMEKLNGLIYLRYAVKDLVCLQSHQSTLYKADSNRINTLR